MITYSDVLINKKVYALWNALEIQVSFFHLQSFI